jgi:hypothetical protein
VSTVDVPADDIKPVSDVYGAEHLLRLFGAHTLHCASVTSLPLCVYYPPSLHYARSMPCASLLRPGGVPIVKLPEYLSMSSLEESAYPGLHARLMDIARCAGVSSATRPLLCVTRVPAMLCTGSF